MKRSAPTLLPVACILLLATMDSPWAGTAAEQNRQSKSAKLEMPAPDFTLPDATGNEHSLSNFKGKYVVLEWTNFDCPFVRKHYKSGSMQRLQRDYAKKGVVWLRICSSAPGTQGHFDAKEITARLKKEKAMQTAYLVDESGKVGRTYGAKTTPHMYVINPQGVLIYAGGIDDKPSVKVSDIEVATNYVSQCLDAALSGKPVETKSATPYGCAVKYSKK